MMHKCIMIKIGGMKKCKLSQTRKFNENREEFIIFAEIWKIYIFGEIGECTICIIGLGYGRPWRMVRRPTAANLNLRYNSDTTVRIAFQLSKIVTKVRTRNRWITDLSDYRIVPHERVKRIARMRIESTRRPSHQ